MKVKDIKRFLSKIDEGNDDECWEWKAATNENGYGYFKFKGKMRRAHRISYIIFHNITLKDIEKEIVMHSCDNRVCINPNHLRKGSQKENIQDCINKKRRYEQKNKNMSV